MGAAKKRTTSEPPASGRRVSSVPPVIEEALAEATFSVEKFVECFPVLVEAAGGLPRLRSLVLRMALSGSLCGTSDGSDQARTLVAQLAEERGHVPPPPCSDGLPPSWCWVPLERAADWANGSGFPKTAQGHSNKPLLFCKVSDMNLPGNERFIMNSTNTVDAELASAIRARVHPAGTVIFPKIGGAIATNKRRILGRAGAIDNNCLGLVPNGHCESDYLHLFLSSIDLAAYQNDGPVPALNQGRLGQIRVPLPPLPEQRRIVARVDQLMALIDELEAKQNRKRELGARFTKASLEALTTAEGPEEFDAAWKRVVENWETVLDRAEKVAEIRRTVLELAVRGRLLHRTVAEASANALVRDVQREPLQGSDPDAQSYPAWVLPSQWTWTTMAETYEVVGGIQKTPHRAPKANHYPYLRVENVQRGRLDLTRIERFELQPAELERWRLRSGDLLVVEGNGSETEIGRCAIWSAEIENCVHQNHIIRCRPLGPTRSRFTLLFLNSPSGMARMRELAITTSGLYSLSVGKIRGLKYPLPPLDEQRRIVAKVDRLTGFCDALEAILRGTEIRASKLTAAVLRHATD
jgi:type I restriction enzyme S subunit